MDLDRKIWTKVTEAGETFDSISLFMLTGALRKSRPNFRFAVEDDFMLTEDIFSVRIGDNQHYNVWACANDRSTKTQVSQSSPKERPLRRLQGYELGIIMGQIILLKQCEKALRNSERFPVEEDNFCFSPTEIKGFSPETTSRLEHGINLEFRDKGAYPLKRFVTNASYRIEVMQNLLRREGVVNTGADIDTILSVSQSQREVLQETDLTLSRFEDHFRGDFGGEDSILPDDFHIYISKLRENNTTASANARRHYDLAKAVNSILHGLMHSVILYLDYSCCSVQSGMQILHRLSGYKSNRFLNPID